MSIDLKLGKSWGHEQIYIVLIHSPQLNQHTISKFSITGNYLFFSLSTKLYLGLKRKQGQKYLINIKWLFTKNVSSHSLICKDIMKVMGT